MGIDGAGVLGPPLLFVRRASAALLRTHAWKITLFAARGFWCRRNTALSSSWVSNLGESTVKEENRSFERSRSKFACPRFRPRGRITKSVTLTTAYNRTILSGTAASAQNKMAKAALHLNFVFSYFWVKVRNFVAYENHTRMPMYATPPLQYENL